MVRMAFYDFPNIFQKTLTNVSQYVSMQRSFPFSKFNKTKSDLFSFGVTDSRDLGTFTFDTVQFSLCTKESSIPQYMLHVWPLMVKFNMATCPFLKILMQHGA